MLLITGGHFGNPTATSVVQTWDRNFDALSTAFHVIAVEKLGQGHTANPLHDDFTMQAVVEHLIAFLDKLGLKNVHLVGQSAGALPVVAIAKFRPDLVGTCTLINTSTLSPGVGMTDVNLAGCPYPPYTRESQRWVMERSAFSSASVTPEYVEAGFEVLNLPKYKEGVRIMQGGVKEGIFLPRLAQLKRELLQWLGDGGLGRPTQVIWGANDRTASVSRGLELFRMIAAHERQSSMSVINEAGHHPFREHPEHFNDLLMRFAKRNAH
ncbi:alpha/beta fold hydrolase [Ralstonia soli]|uniref:Alpha/beta hydrolase n=1 Tax=Ralstonia soli TaxID=2953896 RepID=A0ABT1AMQ6_9RALS|nr:alpha/beta hydrolase [Ralstonia soli]MCO5399719.1 alpha/beta hydrolase [Ralstonia soli]